MDLHTWAIKWKYTLILNLKHKPWFRGFPGSVQPWPILTFGEKRRFELTMYVSLWCSMEYFLYLLPWSSTSYENVALFRSLATNFHWEVLKWFCTWLQTLTKRPGRCFLQMSADCQLRGNFTTCILAWTERPLVHVHFSRNREDRLPWASHFRCSKGSFSYLSWHGFVYLESFCSLACSWAVWLESFESPLSCLL